MSWVKLAANSNTHSQDTKRHSSDVQGMQIIWSFSISVWRKQNKAIDNLRLLCDSFTLRSVIPRLIGRYITRGQILPPILMLGGGGQTSPGVQGTRLPKTKNFPELAHYFLGEIQVLVQKQTKIKMNDIDSPKFGGTPTASTQVVGACPHYPPAPASLSAPCGFSVAAPK